MNGNTLPDTLTATALYATLSSMADSEDATKIDMEQLSKQAIGDLMEQAMDHVNLPVQELATLALVIAATEQNRLTAEHNQLVAEQNDLLRQRLPIPRTSSGYAGWQ